MEEEKKKLSLLQKFKNIFKVYYFYTIDQGSTFEKRYVDGTAVYDTVEQKHIASGIAFRYIFEDPNEVIAEIYLKYGKNILEFKRV